MTKKIYETQGFLKELTTTVTDCEKHGDHFLISLKETIFFPEEGGQYADTGTLVFNGKTAHILYGELTGSPEEGETDIRYLTDFEVPVGAEVLCKLDWDIRFDRMQNHTGEHILSGLIHEGYGYNNTGFHLSDKTPVLLSFDGVLKDDDILKLERQANSVIYADLPVKISFPSKEELALLEYRSKLDIKAQVRLVTIGDEERTVDVCACCAPHVDRTGAVGMIKILSSCSYKGGTRLEILCGRRALEYIEENERYLFDSAREFSSRPEALRDLIRNMKEENIRLSSISAELTEKLILSDVSAGLYGNCVFTDMELSPVSMKNIYNALIEIKTGYCGIFAGNDENGYRYYAGGKNLDAKLLAGKMKEGLSAKGGGSSEMIQGKTAASRDQIESFFINP